MAFPTEWNNKVEFVINPNTSAFDGGVTGYPIIITQNADNFPISALFSESTKARPNGGDIRFTSAIDGTGELPLDLDIYDQSTSAFVVHVKLPDSYDLDNTSTSIYMWWGVGDRWQPDRDDSLGLESVWDSNTKTVLHLSETTGNFIDSTSTSANAVPAGSLPSTFDGIVGKSQLFISSLYDYAALFNNISGDFTISFWFYNSIFFADGVGDGIPWYESTGIIDTYAGSSGVNDWGIVLTSADEIRFGISNGVNVGTSGLAKDVWHHIVCTRTTSGSANIYENGLLNDTSGSTALSGTTPVAINIGRISTGINYLFALIDEIKFSDTIRSDGYIKVEYDNVINQSTMVSAGSPIDISSNFPLDWTLHKNMKVPAISVSGTHSNFPVVLREYNIDDVLWNNIQEDAGDLRITSDISGINILPIEVVTWDNITSSCEVWLPLSIAQSADTNFYVWSKTNVSAEGQPVEDLSYGRYNVWDEYYHTVQHMEYERDDSKFGDYKFVDSTSFNTDSSVIHGGLPTDTSGYMGTSAQLLVSATEDYIQIPGDDIEVTTNDVFAEVVFKTPSEMIGIKRIINKITDDTEWGLQIHFETSLTNRKLYFVCKADSDTRNVRSNVILEPDTWYYVVILRVDIENRMRMYVNGIRQTITRLKPHDLSTNSAFNIGWNDLSANEYFDGDIDDVKVHIDTIRDDEWIFTMGTQVANPDFITVSSVLNGIGDIDIPYVIIDGNGNKILTGIGDLNLSDIIINGDGTIIQTNPNDPQNIINKQLVGEPVILNWAYDLDKYPLTKGEVYDGDVINLSIENILSTLRGERLFNENFGSILPLVLFEHLNYDSASDLLNSLLTSIRRFEKRVTVIKDQVELNILLDDNAFTLVIPYIINRTGLSNTFARKIVL